MATVIKRLDIGYGARQSNAMRRLAYPLLVGVLSRLYSIGVIAVIGSLPGRQPPHDVSPFVDWDAWWYASIATTGYHAEPFIQGQSTALYHDFAFYPGWPLVIRALSFLPVDSSIAAVGTANILFVIALVGVSLVLARHFGPDVSRRAVILLAFAPPAYTFSLAYSEPLFLLIAAGYFLLPGRPWSPIIAFLGVAVRSVGLALGVAAGITWLRDRRDWAALLSALAAGVAFGLWWMYLWSLTGDPLGWFQGGPLFGAAVGPRAFAEYIHAPHRAGIAWLAFVLMMLVASAALTVRRPVLGSYCLTAIGMSLLGAPLSSMPRHAMIAFPAFALLAERAGPRWSLVLAIGFGAAQVAFAYLAFGPQAYPDAP